MLNEWYVNFYSGNDWMLYDVIVHLGNKISSKQNVFGGSPP